MMSSSKAYRFICTVLCLFMRASFLAAQSPGEFIVAYEYWVDDDFASRYHVDVAPIEILEIDESLDLGSLEDGIHNISFRFVDNAGVWSGILKKTFVHFESVIPSNTIVKAEYWFDNDYTTVIELPIDSGEVVEINSSIDCSALSPGFHTISFRFLDLDGNYNPSMNQSFFIKPNGGGTELVIGYRYWFNDNTEDALFVGVSPTDPLDLETEIATTGIGAGPNQRINFQFVNSAFLWTGVYCGYFNRIIGCLADINGDTEINSADLNALLVVYGCVNDCSFADFNGDGVVNSADLNFLLALYGNNCLLLE